MSKKIYFASTNSRKIDSYSKRLLNAGFELVSIPLDIPESRDFSVEEVAKKKLAFAAKKILERPLFVEDRGLEIPSLNNFPGSHVKIVNELMGVPKIMEILKNFDNAVNFVYAVSFIDNNGEKLNFTGSESGFFNSHKDVKNPKNLFEVFCSSLFPSKPLSLLSKEEESKYEEYWTKNDALSSLIKYLKK